MLKETNAVLRLATITTAATAATILRGAGAHDTERRNPVVPTITYISTITPERAAAATVAASGCSNNHISLIGVPTGSHSDSHETSHLIGSACYPTSTENQSYPAHVVSP